jgi:hypothetical protein
VEPHKSPSITVDSHCDNTLGRVRDIATGAWESADIFDSRFCGHWPILRDGDITIRGVAV